MKNLKNAKFGGGPLKVLLTLTFAGSSERKIIEKCNSTVFTIRSHGRSVHHKLFTHELKAAWELIIYNTNTNTSSHVDLYYDLLVTTLIYSSRTNDLTQLTTG